MAYIEGRVNKADFVAIWGDNLNPICGAHTNKAISLGILMGVDVCVEANQPPFEDCVLCWAEQMRRLEKTEKKV